VTEDKPTYVIHSPTKITLSREACEKAREYGLSLEELARHFLTQDALRGKGLVQREGEN
jgi:post-segregation antitoxin (ccd killing protein)